MVRPRRRRFVVEVFMENEMPSVNRVDQIHEELSSLKGQRLRVRANMGRSRIVERTGTLVQAHPSLFVVEVEERRGRTARQSYQYVDVLTGTVELFDSNSGEKIFDFELCAEDMAAIDAMAPTGSGLDPDNIDF